MVKKAGLRTIEHISFKNDQKNGVFRIRRIVLRDGVVHCK